MSAYTKTKIAKKQSVSAKKPVKVSAPAKKPVKVSVSAKKPVKVSAPETSLKAKLMALLASKTGKPVSISDIAKTLYGKETDRATSGALAGVIFGATYAYMEQGKMVRKDGRGATLTLTLMK